ncbi:YqkE family protein [uncultured Psychrobacillus sp.]|mgnify:FL=1|uniref:YqkE family protein n=1 Tax=uncultured Psychrobacillus sp. TaxID=1551585 RepID=UPI00262E7298|nr:YqkE family protein [uncultured Psychrobacillus sp.]
MAKKKQKRQQQPNFKSSAVKEDGNSLSDQLSMDVLAKLKETKKQLVTAEQEKEEERQAQLAFEKKQKEKNKSFEELLDEYGFSGSKF